MTYKFLTDEETGKKIIFLNASALKNSACIRRLALTLGCSLGSESSIATFYGEAFHVFLAELFRGKDFIKALESATDFFNNKPPNIFEDHRNLEHLQEATTKYKLEYFYDNLKTVTVNNEPIVEKTFAVEADDLLPENSNYRLVLFGTIDAVCIDGQGDTVLVDHKTTSVFRKESYLEAYLTSTQLMFYKYVLKRYANKFPELSGLSDVFCQINGIFLNKSGKSTQFMRSEKIHFSDAKIAMFEDMLKTILARLVNAFDSPSTPKPEGFITNVCNSAFGLCPFFRPCANDMIEDWMQIRDIKEYGPFNKS